MKCKKVWKSTFEPINLLNHKNPLCVGIMSGTMYPHSNKVELKSWRPKPKEQDMTINSHYMKYMITLSQQNRLSYESQTYMTQMRIWRDYMSMIPYNKRSEYDHRNYAGTVCLHLNKVELKSWRPKPKEQDMTIHIDDNQSHGIPFPHQRM
jgi:hypothetical protein